MPLRFPNLDALRLAITSGTVPDSVCMAPVEAGFGAEGEVWLQPAGRLTRSVQTALRRLGVKVTRSAGAPLDQLVGAADDRLLAGLAFAVGEREGRRTVVLRARPSKQAPPVLVVDAVTFRPYLKLANLFVPCATRLHPPLRRNAVARLLARDRALERLHRHGLRPEVDLPTFLRTMGMADSARLRLVSERIGPLYRRVRDWIQEPSAQPSPRTKQYAGLMFAYAMARLGDATACEALLKQVERKLVPRNAVHRWVGDAFQFRIRQALDGQPGDDRLTEKLLADVEGMDRVDRYKVDCLRQNSRILEPCERIDPYRNWRRHADDFTARVTALVDWNDNDRLRAEITRLFGQLGSGRKRTEREAPLLATALELAPRLGEAFALELADRVVPLVRRQVEPAAEQRVLEKALLAAAHFDARDHVERFMRRIYRLLERQEIDQAAESLERMLSECFRGLRKLGMRDEIGRLLARLARSVCSPPPPAGASSSSTLGEATALGRSRDTATRSAPSPMRPTDAASSPAATTGRSACGTRRPAGSRRSSPGASSKRSEGAQRHQPSNKDPTDRPPAAGRDRPTDPPGRGGDRRPLEDRQRLLRPRGGHGPDGRGRGPRQKAAPPRRGLLRPGVRRRGVLRRGTHPPRRGGGRTHHRNRPFRGGSGGPPGQRRRGQVAGRGDGPAHRRPVTPLRPTPSQTGSRCAQC